MAVNGIDESGPCGSHGSFRLEQPPFIKGYIETCARHLAAAVGPDEILGIFLCGSFALGEGGISLDPPIPLLVGDIDMLVVLRRYETLERVLPMRYELGSSCEELTTEMEFLGRVDVGFMLPADLESMPPRPGVFDLKNHGKTIHGSGDPLDLIPDHEAERIGGGEAVKLIENRAASFLGCFGDRRTKGDEYPYRFLYEVARVYTDIATALLSISGLYAPGYGNRAKLFEEAARGGGLVVPVSEDLISLVSNWTNFKLGPSRSSLEREPSPAYLGELWDDASKHILWCWSDCESFLQGKERGDASVRQLIAERGCNGGVRTNLRAWRSFLAGKPIRNRLTRILGAGMDLYRRDPSSLVRVSAIGLIERYLEGKTDAGVKGMPGFPGRSWDEWEDAAAEVSTLWREMVYGRRGI